MKKNIFIITTALILSGCGTSSASVDKKKVEVDTTVQTTPVPVPKPANELFTLSEAEKIIGESAHLTDSSTSRKDGTTTYSSAYTANEKESKTGKTGNVYFLMIEYKDLETSKKEYASVLKANEKNEGVEVLSNLGDEAYFHSDGENFYFIQVRKGIKVFRIKVNKLTAKTSRENFDLVAKNIAELM